MPSRSSASDKPQANDTSDQPIINIQGNKVALGPYSRSALPAFERWLNDFEVAVYSGDALIPLRREVVEADFDRTSKEWPRERVEFLIYERAAMRVIGLIELRHINYTDGTADFGIMIGEKDCWGKGYGTEATTLMLDYGFTVLGLRNVMLTTSAFNVRAQRAYTRAGFREFGRRREVVRIGDRRYDDVYMECLASEFTSPLKRVVPLPD